LAFGDHLHFGVVLSGQEVIPIEWWDAKWLEDNVTQKIRRFGERRSRDPLRSTAWRSETSGMLSCVPAR
jgi:hypothetical protein